jgi:hypothetical protein
MNSEKKILGIALIAGAALLASALPACSDDDSKSEESGTGGKGSSTGGKSNGDGGADAMGGKDGTGGKEPGTGGNEPGTGGQGGGGAGAPAEDPDAIYALTTQIFGETENQSYVLLTKTLDENTELSLDDAVVEIAGRALGTGPDEGGVLFVASELAPTITRYDLTENGGLSGGSSVSFLGRGVTKFGEYGGQFQYVSEEKAYWFDGPTAQVVVWNPSTMKVTGSVSLASLAHEGEVLSFTAAPVWKGDKLYTFAAWRAGLVVSERVAVVVVDTATDTATIVEDTSCGYVRDGVLASDGKLYLATEAFGSAAHHLNGDNPAPCLLRFDTSDDSFDDTFNVELSSLFGGDTAGTLVVGPDNQAFLRVLDASAVPEGTDNPRVLASAAAWGWAKLTPGDTPMVTKLTSVAPGSGSVLPFKLGQRMFAPLFVDGESTEFLELTEAGPSTDEAITVPGLVFSAVKLK